MKISTAYHRLHTRFSIERIIEMLSEAGFDGIDYTDIPIQSEVWSDNYKAYAKHICSVAKNCGIEFTQNHAPVMSGLLSEGDENFAMERTIRSLEFTSLIGAKYDVIHPIRHPDFAVNPEYVYEENMKFFSKLIPYAKDFGVKIAIENMMMATLDGARKRDGVCADPREFIRYIDDLNSEYITGCLDFGHSAICGREPQDMLRIMGGRIESVHIHDNDYIKDCHQLPGTMKLKWDEICRTMAEVDYKGDFTLESICFCDGFDDEFVSEALKFMYKTAKHLTDKIL